MPVKRHHIQGSPVDCVDMGKTLKFISDYINDQSNPVGFILAMNPEKVFALRANPFLQNFFEQATLVIPDGIGIVKALRFLYGVKVSRVPGADLMQNICREAPLHGWRLFIYGASEKVNAEACKILERRYPGIRIAGRANGFVPPERMEELMTHINTSGANILFVALGSPKQEEWMAAYAGKLTTVKLCQGIGGTLDTIAGTVKRAPLFWQQMGLEWFYRLLKQPSRFGRQLKLLLFVREIIGAKLSGTTACEEHHGS